MHSSVAVARTPAADRYCRRLVERAIHAIPARSATPKAGVYRKRSARITLVGRIQFDTGRRATKKNKIAKLRAACFLARKTDAKMQANTASRPAHASQSRI